jgi:hypothetical protein
MNDPVREDRAADWGRDGGTVAFQHDQDGVFVADKEGNKVTKIFEPDESVLATSRPLNCPTDGRLIFTTAQALEGDPLPTRATQAPPPEGNVVSRRPVRYTCWLRGEPAGDGEPAPKELFTARCEHVGYIAAGLGVRWHPDGRRVLYLDSTPNSDKRHGVYEFDLATEKTRCVFPHRADDLIFDFTPRGSQLVCVTGGDPSPHGDDRLPPATAIWIGQPDDGKSWWQVSSGSHLASGEVHSLIETLRATRPAWTADDARFAFVSHISSAHQGEPARSLLHLAAPATKRTRIIHEFQGTLADLHWSPDGRTLGFVEELAMGNNVLRFYTDDDALSGSADAPTVRKFAGFDRTGANLAYVVADGSGLPDPSQQWALLLIPNWLSRDRVILAPADEPAAGKEIFSGMRVTFPVWSPTENRLSLWITFVPRYRSLLSVLFRWGLLPGDPAATLNLDTGEVSWMAVTPAEELQVGHYFLLKKDYARAWEWYERAKRKLPARKPPAGFQEFTETLGAPERSQFFEYFCLAQLGRHDEAEARLHEFEANFFPVDSSAEETPTGDAGTISTAIMAEFIRQLGTDAPLILRLIHDFYIAEVFLSVDASEAAIDFFRGQLLSDDGDLPRRSREMVLSQLLLVAGRYEEYLALSPNLLKQTGVDLQNEPGGNGGRRADDTGQRLSLFDNLACVAPLFRRDFLAGVSEESLREAVARWDGQPLEIKTSSDVAINLFLRTAHQTLGNAEAAEAIEARLLASPAANLVDGAKSIDQEMRELVAFFNAFGQFAQGLSRPPSPRP